MLTLPQANTAVVSRGRQQGTGDVPTDAPHLRVVTVKLSHHLNLKLGGAGTGGTLPPGGRQEEEKHLSDTHSFK